MSSSDTAQVSASSRSKLDAAIVSSTEQSNLTAQLQALLDSYPDIANHTIHHTLPLKVQQLTQLHAHFSSLPPPPPPTIEPPASSPPHANILTLLATLKHEIDVMLEAIDTMRIHVSLTIPRMRDQKGLAVVVKEEVVDMLGQGRNSAQSVLDGLPRYFSTRGKLISKCIKVALHTLTQHTSDTFPMVTDYVRAVEELDRKQWRVSVTMLLDLRGNYAVLYDTITKNEDKLTTTTEVNNFEHMY